MYLTFGQVEQPEEADQWFLKYKIAFKSGELRYHFGEPFDELTPDGRNVKVCDSVLRH